MLGPFDEQPIEDMVFSPMNIVPKPGTKKYRLIHDLAYPYNSESVNSCIPEENSSVQYHHIDEVINMVLAIGVYMRGACCDIETVFRHQSMHHSQLFLLGFTFQGKYYINSSLPFGAASSCTIFEKVASALQWIVRNKTARMLISHFLDDFPLLGTSNDDVSYFIMQFYRIMEQIGMPVVKEKTLGPTDLLEYLGLILNFVAQCLEIPEKKRVKCLTLVQRVITAHKEKKWLTVKVIQQTAGSLNFICQALPAGRPFLASLYRLTGWEGRERRALGHHQRISKETCEDMRVFKSFLSEGAEEKVKIVPFLARVETFNDSIELYADVAGRPDLGMGCTFGVDWQQGMWCEMELFRGGSRGSYCILTMRQWWHSSTG